MSDETTQERENFRDRLAKAGGAPAAMAQGPVEALIDAPPRRLPSWLTIDSLFSGTIRLSESEWIKVGILSYGAKVRSILGKDTAEYQKVIRSFDKKYKITEDSTIDSNDVDPDDLAERNEAIMRLGLTQVVMTHLPCMVDWKVNNPVFQKYKPSEFDLTNQYGIELAIQFVSELPSKIMDMVAIAVRHIQEEGMHDDEAQGN